jgi:hypothetical protein
MEGTGPIPGTRWRRGQEDFEDLKVLGAPKPLLGVVGSLPCAQAEAGRSASLDYAKMPRGRPLREVASAR